MSLPILFKDDSLVVCLKPVGISSESPGLPDLIREQEGYPVFPVHRLDQTTGGVCVLKMRKGVKAATCEWSVLETVESSEGRISLILVRLHSGRTHQIRIQFASRKMPLVGDRRYGSRIRAPIPALWSARICFPHPLTDQTIDVSSLPPDCFPWSGFSAILKNSGS